MDKDINPKVFISYSQDDIGFANKVLDFSNKLRSEGIDAILDQYEESPPEGWPRWMENGINDANYVLVIGSIGYKSKLGSQFDKGKGRGVKWEGTIIYQQLYNSDCLNHKYIPIVFSEDDYQYIPTPLQGHTYYNVSVQDRYERLYLRLRGIASTEKPPLGELKPLPEKERKTLFVSSMIDIKTWDKAAWRGAGFLIGYFDYPVLLLPFKNEEYATKIFVDWVSFIGEDDKKDSIRISLVEGEVEGEATGYYITVGTNLDEAIKRAKAQEIDIDDMVLLFVTRYIRANPTDNFASYNMFKTEYRKSGCYYLMPAVIDEQKRTIVPLEKFAIKKHKLLYRDIIDIKENDQDSVILVKHNRH